MKKLLTIFASFLILFNIHFSALADTPQCVKDLMLTNSMKNADFAMIVKDLKSRETIYGYNINKGMIPASTLKIITTSTALELLGPDYRYETILQHDGEVKNGVLYGNIYIKGSGDPTLGSEHFENQMEFLDNWIEAIRNLGIKEVMGSVIADESIFDNQGIHSKWLAEDLGLYYGAGSYGINVFDNMYKLYLKSGASGNKPIIYKTIPEMKLNFINTLTTEDNACGTTIFGIPFSNERYLNGSLSPNSSKVVCGYIPDPALYTADLLTNKLKNADIYVNGEPTCIRLLSQSGSVLPQKRQNIVTIYSPTLDKIIETTNLVSHNLYADALLKTIGTLHSKENESLTSFDKGVEVLKKFWKERGINCSTFLYDGSGLAATNRVTAEFVNEILKYMATTSIYSEQFMNSLPTAGVNGNVKNFLHDTCLQGNAKIKSGSMSGVRCYAGYIRREDKEYTVGIFANNYHCKPVEINKAIEGILLNLFS